MEGYPEKRSKKGEIKRKGLIEKIEEMEAKMKSWEEK